MSVNYSSKDGFSSLEDMNGRFRWFWQSKTIGDINIARDFPNSDKLLIVGKYNFEQDILEPIASQLSNIETNIGEYMNEVKTLTQTCCDQATKLLEEERKEYERLQQEALKRQQENNNK